MKPAPLKQILDVLTIAKPSSVRLGALALLVGSTTLPALAQEAKDCTTRKGSAGLELRLGCTALDATKVEIWGEELSGIARFAKLREITVITGTDAPVDLAPLRAFPDLKRFSAPPLMARDLAPLAGLEHLETLGIGLAGADLAPLAGLENLGFLGLNSKAPIDLAPLSGMAGLHTLLVFGEDRVDMTALRDLPRLNQLTLTGTLETGALRNMPNLNSVTLVGASIADLSDFCALPSLASLSLDRVATPGVASLAGCETLQSLRLTNMGVRDVSWIPSLDALRDLALDGTRPKTLAPLRDLPALETLSLKGVGADLTPLLDMPALSTVIFPDGERMQGRENIAARLAK